MSLEKLLNRLNTLIHIIKMKFYKLLIIVSVLFISSFHTGSIAQTKEKNIFKIIGNDFKISFSDGIYTFTSPSRFNRADWFKAGTTILTTAAFMPYDKDIRKEFSKNHNDTRDKIADVGNGYGNLITPVVLGTGIYSYGLFFKDEYVRETGRMIFESVLFSGIITNVTKVIAGRSRPYTERGPNYYTMFTIDDGSVSFPSAHVTVAFALSSVLANRIHNVYATIGLYSLSTVTALSRLYSDYHWTSDVVLGAAIGYFVGDYISSDRKKCNLKCKVSYNIYPTISGLGMNLTF
jgi:hypothetical protein